jgi:L-iditol 2-dehydrogenase
MRFLATPPIDGALTEYISHPADFCYPLPDNVSLDEGAMLEPLSVGVHACRRGNITPGANVLVMGSGPVGLACLLAAQAMGASEIVVTDINQERLNVANNLGATTFHADSKTLSEDIRDELGQIDLSIDCSGAETAVKTAIDVTVPGGTIVIVGLGSDEMTLPIIRATTREIDIRGIFRYVNAYPTALDMVSSGKVSIDKIISHHFELQDVADAFTIARNAAQGVMKVMVTI